MSCLIGEHLERDRLARVYQVHQMYLSGYCQPLAWPRDTLQTAREDAT